MNKKETVKRYTILVIGLFFSALGVAITKHGELGVSPISSVANVMSYKFPSLSMGSWLIAWNCVLILGQIIILRRKFKPIQLLQVPLSFLFGYFTDFGTWLVSFIDAEMYAVRLAMVFVGTAVLGFGITLAVRVERFKHKQPEMQNITHIRTFFALPYVSMPASKKSPTARNLLYFRCVAVFNE